MLQLFEWKNNASETLLIAVKNIISILYSNLDTSEDNSKNELPEDFVEPNQEGEKLKMIYRSWIVPNNIKMYNV